MGEGAENDLEGALKSEENPGPPPGSGVPGRPDPWESHRAGGRGDAPTLALAFCMTSAEPPQEEGVAWLLPLPGSQSPGGQGHPVASIPSPTT